MLRKILLFSLIGLFLFSFVSAEASIGTVKQGDTIQLTQACANCTYVDLTKVIYPDNTFAMLGEYAMTKNGTNYNYTFSDTVDIGKYYYTACGDYLGVITCQNVSFEVEGGTIGFFIIAFILTFGLTFYGMKIKNEWVSLIGCFGLLVLGVYISFNGIELYKNDLTNTIAYITLGTGLGIGFQALREITYY